MYIGSKLGLNYECSEEASVCLESCGKKCNLSIQEHSDSSLFCKTAGRTKCKDI